MAESAPALRATAIRLGGSGSGDRARPRACCMGTDPNACQNASVSLGCASRSEEHTSELQSLMRTSYPDFCLKKKTNQYMANTTQRKTKSAHHTDSTTPTSI